MRMVLTILSIALLFSATGCSLTNKPDPPEYTVRPYNAESIDISTSVPSVKILSDDTFVLIDGGSSSCKNKIESVNVKNDVLNIKYVSLAPETVCTMDFVIDPQEVSFSSSRSLQNINKVEVTTIWGKTVEAEIFK